MPARWMTDDPDRHVGEAAGAKRHDDADWLIGVGGLRHGAAAPQPVNARRVIVRVINFALLSSIIQKP